MKYFRLIWRNVLRSKRRSLLTIFSLTASLFLLTTLRTVLAELQAVSTAPESDLRLVSRHAVAFTNPLPISYLERIKRIPGVRAATPGSWYAGVYKDPQNFFAQIAVDPQAIYEVMSELQLPMEQKEAFRKQRNAAIAGTRLFDRFGWKIGDRITLQGTNYPTDLELEIVGRFTSINPPDEAVMMFRWDYLDESVGRPGEAAWFTILANSREEMPRIIQTLDEATRSSSAPTKTETEKEFQLSFSGMLGNVQFLVGSISGVVVFTILLVTAATMGMSIRERTAELGVLKSIGFTRELIMALLVGESLVIAGIGWLVGCVGAWALYSNLDLQQATGGWILILRVQPDSLALGLLLAVLVALCATALPAYRAARLSVAEALRYLG